MKIIGSITILFLLAAAILASCNGSVASPVMDQTHIVETNTSTAIAFTETRTAPTPTSVLPTEISLSIPGGMVYYYFVNLANYAPPQGSVVITPDNLVLAPTQLDIVYGSDVAADLRSALDAVLKDERNYWLSNKLQINQISYSGGYVNVVVEGEYYAVAPVVLTAARAQILMTLFSNPAVQSATVMINGDNISNIAISHSMDAKPASYAYTRAEIESFMAENAYVIP